ncbi:MAG: DUF2155 domain-containing protein [Nitrospirae bacterium]|nr:DUF2155 domain-containing protein [Nitrospirota bacterium]
MKKTAVIVLALFIVIAGCKKSQEQKAVENEDRLKNVLKQDLAKPLHEPMPADKKDKKDVPVIVSPEVKAKWKNITFTVTDKTKKSGNDFTISTNGKSNIPGTNMEIEVKDFLPHFIMGEKGIISETNELKNPAARVVITEKNKIIYTGWIFKKYPAVPLFTHDTFEIQLKNAGV